MYKVGDKVIHNQEGACRIREIVDLNISGAVNEYFLLIPILNEATTIYISTGTNKQRNIRPVITSDKYKKIMSEVSDAPLEWIEDPKQRIKLLSNMISSFDFKELLLALECLNTHENEKSLSNKDTEFFMFAKKLVFSELSILLDVDYDMIDANPGSYISLLDVL